MKIENLNIQSNVFIYGHIELKTCISKKLRCLSFIDKEQDVSAILVPTKVQKNVLALNVWKNDLFITWFGDDITSKLEKNPKVWVRFSFEIFRCLSSSIRVVDKKQIGMTNGNLYITHA